jgi:carbon-monoxide dehydrogenase small subunit
MQISLRLDGRQESLQVEPRALLGQVLRDQCSKHISLECETSTCGACTVLLNGDPVKSCALLAPMVDGDAVSTGAGVGLGEPDAVLDHVLAALDESETLPCGVCKPALRVVLTGLLAVKRAPSQDEISRSMSGTICRCTGYGSVIDAVVHAIAEART